MILQSDYQSAFNACLTNLAEPKTLWLFRCYSFRLHFLKKLVAALSLSKHWEHNMLASLEHNTPGKDVMLFL